MAAELARPGVEVTQKFRTTSPTIVVPTLVPCIVGLCRQIVDVVVPSSAGGSQLNSSSLISLPAMFSADAAGGSPPVYGGLDGLTLVLSINHGPDVTVTLSGSSITPASMVAQINRAFALAGVTEALAVVFGTTAFVVKTVGTGDFQTIEVMTGTGLSVLSALGLTAGFLYTGSSAYSQLKCVVPTASFPDPRGNLSQVAIEADSVRAFLALGAATNLKELSRTESVLRTGGTGSAGSVEGTTLLSDVGLYGGGGTLSGKNLNVSIDGDDPIQVILGTPVDAVDLLQMINQGLGEMVATNDGGLRLTSRTTGFASSIEVVADVAPSNDARTALGFGAGNSLGTGEASVQTIDDGNGDALSPLVKVTGANFTAAATVASCLGLTTLGSFFPADFIDKTVTLKANGYEEQTFTFPNSTVPGTVHTLLDAFTTGMGLNASTSGGKLLLETDSLLPLGEEAVIEIVGGTALGALGLVPSLTGTVSLTAGLAPDPTVLNNKSLKIDVGGVQVETTFTGLLSGSSAATIVGKLNLNVAFAAIAVAEVATGDKLSIRALTGGKGVKLLIVAASGTEAATYLGLTVGQEASFERFTGTPYKPVSGDDLYVDGVLVGRITQVAVAGNASVLKLSKQLPLNTHLGDFYFIQAKNLSVSSSTRPTPELIVEGDGQVTIKHNVLRDTNGNVLSGAKTSVYLSYHAVRKDVSASATTPALLRFSSLDEVDSLISPRTSLNPLGLASQLALINAPGGQITALGIDEIAADAPFGTVEAFTRAFELLENNEVYAIAPLTNDETVIGILSEHVKAMSAADQKGERCAVTCPAVPTKKLDELVCSGSGNSQGSTGMLFDTGVVGLAQLLLSAGVNPVGTFAESTGLFLDIASNTKHYSIESISGSVVTIRTAFSAGANDDDFYAETDLNDSPLPSALINETFAVRIRGAALTLTNGAVDKDGVVETVAAVAESYLNRRLTRLFPDSCAATVNGLEQVLDGFYMAAARVGMIGKQSPSTSFTNFPVAGFTRVIGSNDTYSTKHLNQMAAGGVDIQVQEAQGAPVISRMALTTDMTSVETRTDSINKQIDYAAKFVRRGLRSFIGRFNITTGFIDSLGQVIQGLLSFLVDNGFLNGASLSELIQDPAAPDSVLVVIQVQPTFPCNYIRVTLEV